MTHDELLAKVNALDYVLGTEPSGDIAVLALRAVVELHRPITHKSSDDTTCTACRYADEWWWPVYPCSTIQAIEKELG